MIRIPRGTPPSKCKGRDCGATIYWVDAPRTDRRTGTRRVAVDTDQAGGSEPDSLSDGSGVAHSTYCPNAEDFR